MKLRFSKMHGLGNDFVVIDGVRQALPESADLWRFLADRHFGIGCDQILLVQAALQPGVDFRYRIFNADGGEVEQCGNGARCFVRFVHEEGLTDKRRIAVQTLSGIIYPCLEDNDQITVEMGVPRFAPDDLPFLAAAGEGSETLLHPLAIGSTLRRIGIVSMGNPHAVQVVEDVDSAPIGSEGPLIESHPAFPRRVNAGFMQILDRHALRLRVYERGAGETLACGTGACAAAVTAMRLDLAQSPIRVDTRGGALTIAWDGPATPVRMTGPAVTVFRGEIDL